MKKSAHILVIFDKTRDHNVWVTELLEKNDFHLTVLSNPSDTIDPDNYGSVILFTTSEDQAQFPLKNVQDLQRYEKQQFYFGNNNELICTWLLTDHASIELEKYVRTLWSILYIS